MFISFFPRPLPFVVTAVLWGAFTIGLWYTTDPQLTELFGFHIKMVGTVVVRFLWCIYILWQQSRTWMLLSRYPRSRWSILCPARHIKQILNAFCSCSVVVPIPSQFLAGRSARDR
jgi:ABC-type long-subunit fatty acid transport system fused permease/ATPase subunit